MFIFLSSCSDGKKISNKIINQIEQNIELNNIEKPMQEFEEYAKCEIKMTDFTTFKWDKLLIFGQNITEEHINQILGINIKDSIGFKHGMIFLYNNNIVYKEYYKSGIENPVRFSISPHQTPSNGYAIFTPENAIFYGCKYIYNTKDYYSVVSVEEIDVPNEALLFPFLSQAIEMK